jgi:hypothetical protein
MDAELTGPLLSSFRLQMRPWFAMWECAGIWARASLQAFASAWGFLTPRNDALTTWSRALDIEMRTPDFLDWMQYVLRAMRWASIYNLPIRSFG